VTDFVPSQRQCTLTQWEQEQRSDAGRTQNRDRLVFVVKETFAVGRGLVEGQASAVPLIHELNQREEVFAARDTLKASMGEAGTGDPVVTFDLGAAGAS